MFRGQKTLSIDGKHRMSMPASYRDVLSQYCGGRLVANVDINQPRCLAIYPTPVWEEIETKIQETLPNAGATASVLRYLLSNAADVDLDASGKLLLPPHLREHIQIEKTVVLVGLARKFELWREDDWKAEQHAGKAQLDDAELVSDVVSKIGFI